MYKITVNHKTGPIVYLIYEEQEAIKEGIEYRKNWKEGQIGDYVLTDDGLVCKMIQKKEYKINQRQTNTYMSFPFGYVFINMSSGGYGVKLNGRGRKSRYTLSGKKHLDVRVNSNKYKNLAMAYAQCFNVDLAIEMVYGPLPPNRMGEHRRRMRTKEFKKVVRAEIGKLLTDMGFSESEVIEELKTAIVMAKNKNDVSNLMRAIELLVDMHGMNEKKTKKITHELEIGRFRKLIDKVGHEEDRLKFKEVRENEQDSEETSREFRPESEEYGEAEIFEEAEEI